MITTFARKLMLGAGIAASTRLPVPEGLFFSRTLLIEAGYGLPLCGVALQTATSRSRLVAGRSGPAGAS